MTCVNHATLNILTPLFLTCSDVAALSGDNAVYTRMIGYTERMMSSHCANAFETVLTSEN